MRIARALKARALEEPRLLTTLCRHGVYRWAKRLIAARDPQQAGCFGPALAQEKAVPNEDLLREATSLCEELASLASVGPLTKPRALSGAVRLLDQASAGSDARVMKQALQAVRDLLFGAGCDKCTAFEMESVNFAGRLLRLLQGSGKLQQDRWAIFEEVFQLREPKAPKAAMRRLLEVLQAMVCTAECFPIWRYKRDRGLKALTEPVQLRLEHWQRASKEPSQKGRSGRDVVSVMVEPLVSLSEILRYLLRVTPVVTEEYLTFCHTLVGCSLRDTASGEVVKVLSFELLLTDCPVPIHTVQCAAGETQRLLLALRDYEYAVSEGRCPAAEFRASLSALHAIGGSHQYAKLLDELDEHLRTGNVEPSEESPDREVRRRSRDIRRGRPLCTSDSEEDGGTTSSSSSGAEVRRRGTKRCAEAAAKNDSIAGEAFKRAVHAAQACDQATEVLHTERRRVAQAMLALNVGDMPGMSSVDPVSRAQVHSVTLAVPEEIPLDVFWPMVQEDIMGAVQEYGCCCAGITVPSSIRVACPHRITLGVITLINFLVTITLVVRWGIKDARLSHEMCEQDQRPLVPYSIDLVRGIVYIPAAISSVAFVVMLRPATAYTLELCMAILSCVVVGNMTRYFLVILGEPPLPAELLNRVPKRRWWCGTACGGVNDTLPGMGLMWSKQAHRVTMKDIFRSNCMIRIFIVVFILVNSMQLSLSMFPGSVEMDKHGWCVSNSPLTSPGLNGALIFFSVWSSFVGMAGFGVVSGSISSVLDLQLRKEDEMGEEADDTLIRFFRVASQSKTVAVYMLLPLLLPILSCFPMGSKEVLIPVQGVSVVNLQMRIEKETTLMCPVYDREVCAHTLYGMFVSLGMTFVSIRNYRIFRPADISHERLLEVLARLNPVEETPSGGDLESDETSESARE
ncbi:unnamed protein product [Symbiodinium sp. CCMP2456]|nr:unnamed protein product [Symbiodinium sp. CCMP2456]